MKNKKSFFRECFACYCGHKCEKQKLPRKKKKQYKKFRELFDAYRNMHFSETPSVCSISDDYKRDKPLLNLFHFIQKFKIEIDYLRKNSDPETVYINDNGRLSWYWEYDNDYGGESGLMNFCYNEKDAGNTWAFSELKATIRHLLQDYSNDFVFPEEINSDKSLLIFIRNHLKN